MKIIITIAVQLFIGLALFSQGNLQYNQTKHIEVIGNLTPSTNGGVINAYTLVVPAGKTFKITSAAIHIYRSGYAAPFYGGNYNCFLTIGNTLLAYSYPLGAYNPAGSTKLPIWLPSGTYTVKIEYDIATFVGLRSEGYFSGIEFNIVP